MAINLIVLEGKHRGRHITLPRTQFVIGRESSCHLRPVSLDVSKFHCAIAHQGDRILVRDLRSTNGTFLNGKRIRGTIRARDGDVLQLGPLQFMFQVLPAPELGPGQSSHEWLLRSPDELEERALDVSHETMIMPLDKISNAELPVAPPPSGAGPPQYSEQASMVAGKFLREYVATRKLPGRR